MRAVRSGLSVGGAFRGYSFEQDLADGYFDPDFFGIWELVTRWRARPSSWILSAEVAPGLQRVTRRGSVEGALRSNLRVARRLGTAREVSLTYGYSSAGLASFATAAPGYRYQALVLGLGWVF